MNGHDEEVAKGMSFVKNKNEKNRQSMFLKALETLDHHQDTSVFLTWENFCEMAVDQLLSKNSRRTLQSWFRACKLNNVLVPISKQHFHQTTKELSPFLEHVDKGKGITLRDSEDMYKELRSWELENLEELTLDMITN